MPLSPRKSGSSAQIAGIQVHAEDAESRDGVLRASTRSASRPMSLSRSSPAPARSAAARRAAPRSRPDRRCAGVEIDAQLAAVLHALAVEREHHVARPQSGASPPGRAASRPTESRPLPAPSFSASAISGVTVCGYDADLAAAHAAGLADLREHVADDVARRGEADAFVAAGLAVDQRVDADQASVGVDQRAAAAARD